MSDEEGEERYVIESFKKLEDSLDFHDRYRKRGYRPIVVLPYDMEQMNRTPIPNDLEVLLTNMGEGYVCAQVVKTLLAKQEGWETPEPIEATAEVERDIIGFYRLRIAYGLGEVTSYRPITLFRDVNRWVASPSSLQS